MIRIKSEPGSLLGPEISTMDGQPIDGVTHMSVRFAPVDIVRAEIEIFVGAVDVTAHPLLTLETIKSAAAAHGYRLVAID